MGAVGGLLGTSGGAGGSGFASPSFGGNAPTNPLDLSNTSTPLAKSYFGNQDAILAQQKLLAQLQSVNGIGNQQNVYNQLQGVVNGTGPNPAQAMLSQATGQNVSNQAALMASQRGAGANVGLLARQAAQQGANTQQQAVGQAATMQANQSLGALGQAGTLAGNQVSNQIGQVNANTQAQQSEQSNLLNAMAGYNATNAGLQANINTSNASLANTTMNGQQSLIGGAMNKAGGLAGLFADGGDVEGIQPQQGPQSNFGRVLVGIPQMPNYAGSPDAPAVGQGAKDLKSGIDNAKMPEAAAPAGQAVAGGGDSLGAAAGPAAMVAAHGGMTHDYRGGGGVKAKTPNQKAVVHGNDYANDKIPAVLSEGEVVIPRSVMQSRDPSGAAAKFVATVMQQKKMKG